jgi:hypothetical protein
LGRGGGTTANCEVVAHDDADDDDDDDDDDDHAHDVSR